jgi:RNA polymerase sigma factor (sigma-70 family)
MMVGRTIEIDDDELLRRWRAGDRAAGSELCRRHHDAARRYARRLARGVADPDDIVAEAFAKVLRAMTGGLGPRDGFRRYLFASVRSCAFDAHRTNLPTTHEVPDLGVDGGYDSVGAESSPMLTAFGELPERARQILWLLEVEGWSAGEVARANGSTPGAVSALAYRTRTQLRRRYLAHLAASQEVEPSVTPEPGRFGVIDGEGALEAAHDAGDEHVVIDLTALAGPTEHTLRTA